MINLHIGQQNKKKQATCPNMYGHRGWKWRWFQPLPLSHAVAGSHHLSHPLFLCCLPVLSTSKPWGRGGKHSLDFPALLPSLQLSKSFKTYPQSHLFQKAPTDTPVWNNSVPGPCAEKGCSFSISRNYLVLGHFSAGLSAWWHNHRGGSVCS